MMTQPAPYLPGQICHLELPITDVERAKRFYGEAFGWTFKDAPEMSYTFFFTPDGRLTGAFFHPTADQPARPILYIQVASIEASMARVQALGGKATGPVVEVPGHGKLQHFVDSEGTAMALWQ